MCSSISWWRRGASVALGGAGRVSARGAELRLAPALPADAGHYACAVAAPTGPAARRDVEIQVRSQYITRCYISLFSKLLPAGVPHGTYVRTRRATSALLAFCRLKISLHSTQVKPVHGSPIEIKIHSTLSPSMWHAIEDDQKIHH